ncbi:TPA: DUF2065 domain-containing protein [Klebsiella pneumoniae]
MQEVGIALCLLLVLEGIVPFASPRQWRSVVLQLAGLSDRHLRQIGLASMLLGTVLVYLFH